ncbi:MAG: hypothetical protein KKI09_14685 [Spirochaetes bacterium]|nr:hypothetical protein [Spirochaetota bacterium]MBU0956671.1 hypothetical protein [Spirochaetota bacterium]
MKSGGWIVLALLLNLAGSLALKTFTAVPISLLSLSLFALLLGGIYLARAITWLALGRRFQLSFVYPLLSINYLAAYAIGLLFFSEALTATRVLGCLLISGGAALLGRSKHSTESKSRNVVGSSSQAVTIECTSQAATKGVPR